MPWHYHVKMFVLKYLGWVQIAANGVSIGAGLWLNSPETTIFDYRFTSETLLMTAIVSACTAGVFGLIYQSCRTAYVDAIKLQHSDEVRLLRDEIYNERQEALRAQLQGMAQSDALAFGPQERICVYSYKENERKFACASRYSDHQEYTTYSERDRYPVSEGVIGTVWQDAQHRGQYRDKSFPDGRHNKKAWQKYLNERYKIKPKVSKKFRMLQRDMYAEVIKDTKGRSVAVIVFESERASYIDDAKIKSVYNDSKKNAIVVCLEKLKSVSNSVSPPVQGEA